MWKSRMILVGVTVILTIFLSLLGLEFSETIAIVLFIVMTAYIFISLRRQQARINLLMKDCDPKAFLERTINQEGITSKKGQYKTNFALDKSAAYCYMNEYDKALNILEEINIDPKATRKNIRNIYYINKIATLFGLKRYDEAEVLYIEELQDIKKVTPIVKRALLYLEGDRAFNRGNYENAKDLFEALQIDEKVTLRKEFLVLRLAQIELQIGNRDKALEGFNSIINKAYPKEFGIAAEAEQMASSISEVKKEISYEGNYKNKRKTKQRNIVQNKY